MFGQRNTLTVLVLTSIALLKTCSAQLDPIILEHLSYPSCSICAEGFEMGNGDTTITDAAGILSSSLTCAEADELAGNGAFSVHACALLTLEASMECGCIETTAGGGGISDAQIALIAAGGIAGILILFGLCVCCPNRGPKSETLPSQVTTTDSGPRRIPIPPPKKSKTFREQPNVASLASIESLRDGSFAAAQAGDEGATVDSAVSSLRQNFSSRMVQAPPGRLGIVIDTTPEGPVVHRVNDNSVLKGEVFPGDLIAAVDQVDTRAMSAAAITALMVRTSHARRKLTVLSPDITE